MNMVESIGWIAYAYVKNGLPLDELTELINNIIPTLEKEMFKLPGSSQ